MPTLLELELIRAEQMARIKYEREFMSRIFINPDRFNDGPHVENGRIVGYVVKPGQGFTQIADDINNPFTQQDYGYNLGGHEIQWYDIANHPENKKYIQNAEFQHTIMDKWDEGYCHLDMNPGDYLHIVVPGIPIENTDLVVQNHGYYPAQPESIWVIPRYLVDMHFKQKREEAANGGVDNSEEPTVQGCANRIEMIYGKTIKERALNPKFWYDVITLEGEFKPGDNVIQISFKDNPVSFFVPFGQLSKASLGYKTLGGASKTTMVTTAFFKEIGASGSLNGRWFTPLGAASNWETFLGRWMPFLMESGLTNDYIKKENK